MKTGPVLVPVLGDQLSPALSSLADRSRNDTVVLMMEVADETTYVRHHQAKIALILSAMRHLPKICARRGGRSIMSRLTIPTTPGRSPAKCSARCSATARAACR